MFAQYEYTLKAIGVIIVFFFGAAIGYGLRGLAADAEIGLLKASHAETLKEISDAAAKAAADALQRQEDLSNQIAAIDQNRTEEIERAKIELDKLRNDIAVGNRRLSVVARCPAAPVVPEDSGSPGVGNDTTRAELDPEAANRIIAITTDGDTAIRQLSACQDYVRAITGQ